MVVARTLCPVARFDLPHFIGKLLQRGPQPSLVVSFFLLFAFVHSRNPFHFGNERFDDLVNCLVDGHRLLIRGDEETPRPTCGRPARRSAGVRAGGAKTTRQEELGSEAAATHSTGARTDRAQPLPRRGVGKNAMSRFTPRRGMPSPRLNEGEFRRRFLAQFKDPAFDALSREHGAMTSSARSLQDGGGPLSLALLMLSQLFAGRSGANMFLP